MRRMGANSGRTALVLLLAASLAILAPQTALAGNKGERPAAAVAPTDLTALDAQEKADSEIVQEALQAMVRSRAAGLKPKLKKIREVLARAPAAYPLIEDRGEVVIVRGDGLALTILAMAPAIKDKRSASVEKRFNTYIYAAFILGWYANEVGDPEAALESLDIGLALQPGNVPLSSEKSVALGMLKRFPEALVVNDEALAQPLVEPNDQARLQRNRGFILIELNRLDEAEAAYKESLKLEPGDSGALNELAYIQKLRAGAPPVAPTYQAE